MFREKQPEMLSGLYKLSKRIDTECGKPRHTMQGFKSGGEVV
jgi:hypothetical protein